MVYSVTSFYCTRVLAAHSVKAQKHDSGPSVTSTSKHSLFKGPLVKLLFSLLSILLFTYSKLNHLSQSLGFQALNIFYSLRHKAETSQCFFWQSVYGKSHQTHDSTAGIWGSYNLYSLSSGISTLARFKGRIAGVTFVMLFIVVYNVGCLPEDSFSLVPFF